MLKYIWLNWHRKEITFEARKSLYDRCCGIGISIVSGGKVFNF
jgi:hypothetical protein